MENDMEKSVKKINLGVIGCGMAWEKLHYPALSRLQDKFEIKAICDRNIGKAKEAAQKLGLGIDKAYDDYEQILGSGSELQIDAYAVMVPISDNYDVAKSVIEHKKNLLAEKPLASTLKGAEELCALAKSNKVKVLVAENWRYDEAMLIIKEVIDSKRIGNVAYFIDNNLMNFTSDMLGEGFAAVNWRQHPDFPGGIFLDSGVHHIAKHRFLFGEVLDVYAAGRPGGTDFCPYSCINAMLRFKDHITGHYSFFNITRETQAPLVGFRIFGTSGEIYLEDKDCGFVNLTFKDGGSEAIAYKPNEGYYREYINFYNALTGDEQIVADPEKETGDIKVIFDILKSIEIGEIIKSADAEDPGMVKRARKPRKKLDDVLNS